MSKKAVFICDICKLTKESDLFNQESQCNVFCGTIDFKTIHSESNFDRQTKELCPECTKKGVEELKNFLAQSKYYY